MSRTFVRSQMAYNKSKARRRTLISLSLRDRKITSLCVWRGCNDGISCARSVITSIVKYRTLLCGDVRKRPTWAAERVTTYELGSKCTARRIASSCTA